MGSIAAEETPIFFPSIREKAIIHHGDEYSLKSAELLTAFGLPDGLLPVTDVVEGGWVEETGFSWTVSKQAQQHHFVEADRHCKYDELISCTMSQGKMTDIHGVRAKDLGIWVPVNEIYIDSKNPEKLVFKSIMGLSRSLDANHFKRGVK